MERYAFKWFICRQCGHMQGRPARFARQGLCVRCQPSDEPEPTPQAADGRAFEPEPDAEAAAEPDPADVERDRVARWLLGQAGVL